VFLIAGIIMIVAALLAFLTPVYRRVSSSYSRAATDVPGTATRPSRPLDA
jgi:DHA3 family multidrug efflux protein-like MFS transporter